LGDRGEVRATGQVPVNKRLVMGPYSLELGPLT